ncbi:uncharacterized protein CLUP02_16979, partial [Colletotrichum lupini]
ILRKLEDNSLALVSTYAGTYTISALFTITNDAKLRFKIVNTYIYGLRGIYKLYISISGLALLISFLIRRVLLNRSL